MGETGDLKNLSELLEKLVAECELLVQEIEEYNASGLEGDDAYECVLTERRAGMIARIDELLGNGKFIDFPGSYRQ